MRKIIAAINMTVDGFCDHTSVNPDEEVHDHYTNLIKSAETILYRRITYQLMETYWPTLVKNPSGQRSMDEFAVAIQSIHKVVFSHTVQKVDWENAEVANMELKEKTQSLANQTGGDILVGSPSLISQLMEMQLIDEFQLCIHPVIAGKGKPLLENISKSIELKVLKTKSFKSGAMLMYYKPV